MSDTQIYFASLGLLALLDLDLLFLAYRLRNENQGLRWMVNQCKQNHKVYQPRHRNPKLSDSVDRSGRTYRHRGEPE